MTYGEEQEFRINQAAKSDQKAKKFKQELRNIQQEIEDGYGIPVYYIWETKKLTWDKPTDKLYTPLWKPDYTPEVMGIEIGSLVNEIGTEGYGFGGQVSWISISQNRIETSLGPKRRGCGYGGSLNTINKLEVLVKGSELVKLYEEKGY